jgi:hypothetical protein
MSANSSNLGLMGALALPLRLTGSNSPQVGYLLQVLALTVQHIQLSSTGSHR